MHRPDSPWLFHAAKWLGNGGCFLAALAASALAIRAWLPFPDVPDIAAKWRYFAENKDRFDTIFVGSSRFRHQIIPRFFDEETAAHGAVTHSLNLSYSGMWPPENFYFLRQLLALRPAHLKWVVFEVIDGETRLDERDAATLRTAYWHDWPHTRMAWRMVAELSSSPPLEKCRLGLLHARIFLRQFLHFGRGAEWVEKRFHPSKMRPPPEWIARLGFDPEPEPGVLTGPALAEYLETCESLKKPRPTTTLRPGLLDALREIHAEVRAAGAEALFVLPPTVSAGDNIAGLPGGMPCILFNDLHEFARLYEPELHYDAGHLNEKGAAEFSRLLAERFAAWERGRR